MLLNDNRVFETATYIYTGKDCTCAYLGRRIQAMEEQGLNANCPLINQSQIDLMFAMDRVRVWQILRADRCFYLIYKAIMGNVW